MQEKAHKSETEKDVGVYVHVPFCARICPYCDFAVEPAPELLRDPSAEAFRDREDRTVSALIAELEARQPDFAGRRLSTLYFGGGTPGLLRADSLARLHEAVGSAFPPALDAESELDTAVEVTLEVNPSTLERDRLKAFADQAGINRLSVGVQSFDDSVLKALGRAHRVDEIHRTLQAARAAGFENLSVDLMFAVLHQNPAMLEADLQAILAFGPEHVSTYELVPEPGTPFGRAAEAGQLDTFDEDGAADMLLRIESVLGGAGYERYELTNFAQPGRASRHNQRYWARQPVLAIGPGAHSTDPAAPGQPFGRRVGNEKSWSAWLERIEAGRAGAPESEEILDAGQARSEAFFLGLRTRAGVSAEAIRTEFGGGPRSFYPEAIERMVGVGLMVESVEGDLALTAQGRLLADEVAAAFVAEEALAR
ncbi:radical SAM family heme chaperone HemW [Myxococcota bacterium]|nr:radical SAM family heme chaperone HemW [Myxococcota bacterium]